MKWLGTGVAMYRYGFNLQQLQQRTRLEILRELPISGRSTTTSVTHTHTMFPYRKNDPIARLRSYHRLQELREPFSGYYWGGERTAGDYARMDDLLRQTRWLVHPELGLPLPRLYSPEQATRGRGGLETVPTFQDPQHFFYSLSLAEFLAVQLLFHSAFVEDVDAGIKRCYEMISFLPVNPNGLTVQELLGTRIPFYHYDLGWDEPATQKVGDLLVCCIVSRFASLGFSGPSVRAIYRFLLSHIGWFPLSMINVMYCHPGDLPDFVAVTREAGQE